MYYRVVLILPILNGQIWSVHSLSSMSFSNPNLSARRVSASIRAFMKPLALPSEAVSQSHKHEISLVLNFQVAERTDTQSNVEPCPRSGFPSK